MVTSAGVAGGLTMPLPGQGLRAEGLQRRGGFGIREMWGGWREVAAGPFG